MGVGDTNRVDPYNFDPQFERALVALSCISRRFYGRVGHAVQPDSLGAAPAQLALRAAQAVAHAAAGNVT